MLWHRRLVWQWLYICKHNVNKTERELFQLGPDKTEGDTTLPPCVLHTAQFWPCVHISPFFWHRILRIVLTTKTNIFGVSIDIKKIIWQYVACTTIFENVFDIPKSMLKFINVEMTRNSARERAKNLELFDIVCHIYCVAYRPFAYCVPSKPSLSTAYQKRGVITLKIYM